MGRTDKYEGGSKLVAFRLPLRHLEEAKKGIRLFLERFTSKPPSITEKGWLVAPGQVYDVEKAQSFVERLLPVVNDINVAEVKKKADKLKLPKKLVEKLKELDPKIVIPDVPGEKEVFKDIVVAGEAKILLNDPNTVMWPGVTNPKEKLIIDPDIPWVKKTDDGGFEWSCGCTEKDKLFRRSNNCKFPILRHLK